MMTQLPLFVVGAIAIIYAVIAAFIHSKKSHGPWKRIDFAIRAAICLATVLTVWVIWPFDWYRMFPLVGVFAGIFWIFFDSVQGYIRTKNILHIGMYGFDAWIKRVVGGVPVMYLIFKIIWTILFVRLAHGQF